jgi:transcription elongation factor GreB
MTITIVGIDEAELDRAQVSWLSPIARALMKARQGDIVDLRGLIRLNKSRNVSQSC